MFDHVLDRHLLQLLGQREFAQVFEGQIHFLLVCLFVVVEVLLNPGVELGSGACQSLLGVNFEQL